LALSIMSNSTDSVRFSQEGHDFHILWTARLALRLLNPTSDLVAVAVEGISPKEAFPESPIPDGLLGVDTTLYFGSEEISTAKQIVYCQMKHSTVNAERTWSSSELEKTIKHFGERFHGLQSKYDLADIENTIRFRFVSNRAVSKSVECALRAARTGHSVESLPIRVRQAYIRLQHNSGLDSEQFQRFARLLVINRESGRQSLATDIEIGLLGFVPCRDPSLSKLLKDLVRRFTFSEKSHNPLIRREDVLNALRITPQQFFPAPAIFEVIESPIAREQELEIIKAIIQATKPVVIHGPSGVGKSVIANRLSALMPEGSIAVVFDGFAGGAYRNQRTPRHRCDIALVQIANELASKGLCDPVLPHPQASNYQYLQAFRNRIKQAVATLQAHSPGAVVVIILDAADNSVVAAEVNKDKPYVWGLLEESPPDGCRIVALARTERLELLRLADHVLIELKPYTLRETAIYLRARFPEASEDAVKEFHRISRANPRVQAYHLRSSETLEEAIEPRKASGKEADAFIATEVENALQKIRRHAAEPQDIDKLCFALAQLPPLVPLRILAKAADVPISAVESFVTDLHQPLLHRAQGVQFRDEPVEYWFRTHFPGDQHAFTKLADSLYPLRTDDTYVATALPRLLFEAGRHDELIELALHDPGTERQEPAIRREILLNRLQYAIKAKVDKRQMVDVAKLLLRAAEILASKGRQAAFISDHGDLIACLTEPDFVLDLIYRSHQDRWSEWKLCNLAFILVSNPVLKHEARPILCQAEAWVKQWSSMPDDEKRRKPAEVGPIAALAIAICHVYGVNSAVHFIQSWRPKTFAMQITLILARHLIDFGHREILTQIYSSSSCDIFFLVGLVRAMDEASLPIPEDLANHVAKRILSKDWDQSDINADALAHMRLSAIIAAEALAFSGHTQDAIASLTRALPDLPSRPPWYLIDSDIHEVDLELVLRAYCLKAAIEGNSLEPENLIPTNEYSDKDRGKGYQDRARFERVYKPMLPIFLARARYLAHQCNAEDVEADLSAACDSFSRDAWRYREELRLHNLPALAAQMWIDTSIRTGKAESQLVNDIQEWLKQFHVTISSWIKLARRAAHCSATAEAVCIIASNIDKLVQNSCLSAQESAAEYMYIARAIFPVSKTEAQAYVAEAFNFLGRIDQDARFRLEVLCDLANRAKSSRSQPMIAYRLSRIAELIYEYNDHNFPWDTVAKAVTTLCPTSGLAIISRWRDRGKGRFEDTLPAVVKQLVEEKQIESGAAAALEVFGRHWKYDQMLIGMLENEPQTIVKEKILDYLIHDLERESTVQGWAARILDIARRFCLPAERLEALISSLPYETSNQAQYQESTRDKSEVDLLSIIGNRYCTTPEEIDTVVENLQRVRQKRTLLSWMELHKIILKRIRLADRLAHVNAIISSKRLILIDIIESLEEIAKEWQTSRAIRDHWPQVIDKLIQERGLELLGRFGSLAASIQMFSELSGNPHEYYVHSLLALAAERIEQIPVMSLLELTRSIAETFSPDNAIDVLTFALTCFEPLLDEEDGDGEWTDTLEPPRNISEAIAGLVWACLASPDSEVRWKAAHAVRRLCALGQHEVINALLSNIDSKSCTVFSDRRLPFYHFHSRLYLLIALARASQDNPEMLLASADIFERLALDDFPHVLINKYSAEIALTLEEAFPGTLSQTTKKALLKVNVSPFKKVHEVYSDYTDRIRNNSIMRNKENRFRFEYDMARYWFGELGRVFNISANEVAQRVENWIIDYWGVEEDAWHWDRDPRLSKKLIRSERTGFRYHEYPREDRYSFYITLHALFYVAGELCREKPQVISNDDDLWEKWMCVHGLTRTDGRWLSDRCDPEPVDLSERSEEALDKKVDFVPADFKAELLILSSSPIRLVVWSKRETGNIYSDKTVSVSSALVSPNESMTLLRVLQSYDLHSYRIPPAFCRGDYGGFGIRLIGWIIDEVTTNRLDKFDPFSGGIAYPPLEPRPAVLRLMGLHADSEKRKWQRVNGDEQTVLWSQVWGMCNSMDRSRDTSDGRRLVADIEFLREFLDRIGYDLIIGVSIGLHKKSKGLHTDFEQHVQLYCFNADGKLLDNSGDVLFEL